MRVCTGTEYGDWETTNTGKGHFLNRLMFELRELGVIVVSPANKADIDLQLGKYVWEPMATKSIIRMGCPHFNDPASNKRKISAISFADAVIYQSKYAKKWCNKLLVPAKKSTVIHNGAVPNLTSGNGPEPVFLASTRIWNAKKRLKDIVKGFQKAGVGTLYIAGKVDKKIKAPNVIYTGTLTQDGLSSYYNRADVLIHMCERDCCPNSVVEAMMSGCRVITNADAGTPELLTEHDIVIDKMKELPNAIRSMKPNRMYPEWLDIKNVAKRYYEFFQEALDG